MVGVVSEGSQDFDGVESGPLAPGMDVSLARHLSGGAIYSFGPTRSHRNKRVTNGAAWERVRPEDVLGRWDRRPRFEAPNDLRRPTISVPGRVTARGARGVERQVVSVARHKER